MVNPTQSWEAPCRKTEKQRYTKGRDSPYPIDLAPFVSLPVFTSAVFPVRECSSRKNAKKALAFSVLVSYNTIEPPTPSIGSVRGGHGQSARVAKGAADAYAI